MPNSVRRAFIASSAAILLLLAFPVSGVEASAPHASAPLVAPAPGPGWNTTAVLPASIRAISCISRERCMAAGIDGLALSTIDGGTTWAPHRIAGTKANLTGVSCPTTTTCWISLLEPGKDAEVARTNDFGTTWSVALSGLWSSPSAIACTSATHCWVAGQDDGGQPELSVTDDGTNWSIVGVLGSEDFPGYFTSVSCPAVNHCTAVGGKTVPGGHVVLIFTTTDGVNWVNQSVASPLSVVRSVSCANPTHCLAVGVRLYASIPTDHADFALATTDGSTWHSITLPEPLANVDAVSCPVAGGGSQCVVVASGTALTTPDGGSTWAAHTLLSSPGVGTAGLSCVDAQYCWAAAGRAGNGGPIALSTDGGATWTGQSVPAAVGPLHQIVCPTDSHCVAVGGSGMASSPDGGTTWTTSRITPDDIVGVACGDDQHCVAAGAGAALWTSVDGGASWNPGPVPGSAGVDHFTGVACPSATECVAGYQTATGAGVLRTTDGGTWAAASVPAALSYISGVSCGDPDHCAAMSSDPASGAAAALVSSDAGAHWAIVDLPNGSGRFVSAIDCPDATHCWAAAFDVPANAYLYRSSDSGASWQLAAQPPVAISSISCTSANHCWAAGAERGAHAPGGVFVTADGLTWAEQSLPTDAGLGAIAISCNPGWCRAVTQSSDPTNASVGSTVVALSRTASQSFVNAAYSDLLHRLPTSADRVAASALLDAAPSSRSAFLLSLTSSPEWSSAVVRQLYLDALGRAGDPGGVAYWAAAIASGRATVAQVASQLYASDEFFHGQGFGTVNGWVTELYSLLLHRSPDAAGLSYWVARTGVVGRTAVATAFFQTPESAANRVVALYGLLLQRAPESGGVTYWAARIVQLGDLALAANLVASREYYQKAQSRFP